LINIEHAVNTMKKLLFASIISFVCVTSMHAQSLHWQPTNGPFSGDINCYAASANYVYAGIEDTEGIYRSSDNGASWTWIGKNLALSDVAILCAGGKSVFAASDNGGFFRSSDNGNTWLPVTGLNTVTVTALIMNDSAVFAATNS